jgi:hypothetical protein
MFVESISQPINKHTKIYEMSKQTTAVQEVILKMNEAKNNFPALGFDEEFVRGFNKAFQMAVFIAEKIGIQKEREQIEKTYSDSIDDLVNKDIVSPSDYYRRTFKNESYDTSK